MKRINPATNQPFKSGDMREDGQLFRCYDTSRLRKDGTFAELWLNPASFAAIKSRMMARARKRRHDAAFKRTQSIA